MRRAGHNFIPMFCGRLQWTAVVCLALALGCESPGRSRQATGRESPAGPESRAPYQSEVEEGLGAAVAILVDTSGSMKEDAPGDSRPKYIVAREALEAMLDATDAVVAKRPGFPVKVGIYSFSSSAQTLLPMQA
jgi:hypothetical protein